MRFLARLCITAAAAMLATWAAMLLVLVFGGDRLDSIESW